MFPYSLYKVVHIVGILLLATGLSGLSFTAEARSGWSRRFAFIFHGVGLFLVLLGGFGMLARLGITSGLPGWIWAKLTIWVILAAIVMLPLRIPAFARPLWFLVPILGTAAAYIALYKPF